MDLNSLLGCINLVKSMARTFAEQARTITNNIFFLIRSNVKIEHIKINACIFESLRGKRKYLIRCRRFVLPIRCVHLQYVGIDIVSTKWCFALDVPRTSYYLFLMDVHFFAFQPYLEYNKKFVQVEKLEILNGIPNIL